MLSIRLQLINAYPQRFRYIFQAENMTLANEIMDDFISLTMPMDGHSEAVR